MLKKRSRPQVSSTNQGLMSSEPFSLPSPTSNNYNKTQYSPLFPLSPRLFVGFTPSYDTTNVMSPTSILETKPFSSTSVANPFFSEKNPRKPFKETAQKQPVGLGIVDELKPCCKPDSRMVLFGSQLKIQIPSVHPNGVVEFGVKNRDAQLALLSPAMLSPMGPVGLVSGCLSPRDMEMSEDYTCVIAHGPNPRTTHIFDNCIVENCGDGFGASVAPVPTPRREERRLVLDDFLTCCHACNKELGQGKDIFMYRGEKAFCSLECRYQEMLFDEEMEDYSPPTSSTL